MYIMYKISAVYKCRCCGGLHGFTDENPVKVKTNDVFEHYDFLKDGEGNINLKPKNQNNTDLKDVTYLQTVYIYCQHCNRNSNANIAVSILDLVSFTCVRH